MSVACPARAATASAGWFLPKSGGSPNADGIRTLYILITVIGLVIFIGVEGLLVYSMIKFRARKGATAAQIHGIDGQPERDETSMLERHARRRYPYTIAGSL